MIAGGTFMLGNLHQATILFPAVEASPAVPRKIPCMRPKRSGSCSWWSQRAKNYCGYRMPGLLVLKFKDLQLLNQDWMSDCLGSNSYQLITMGQLHLVTSKTSVWICSIAHFWMVLTAFKDGFHPMTFIPLRVWYSNSYTDNPNNARLLSFPRRAGPTSIKAC